MEQIQERPVQVHRAVVESYFSGFNRNDFAAVAALFAADGELHAPFESPIVGPKHIQAYLEQEARSMKAIPREFQKGDRALHSHDDSDANNSTNAVGDIIVKGVAQTPTFQVNIAWSFSFNASAELTLVRVRILASLQDLLHLRPS